jgi:hypothetical protein
VYHAMKDGVQTGDDNQRNKDSSQEASFSGRRTSSCNVCVIQMPPTLHNDGYFRVDPAGEAGARGPETCGRGVLLHSLT